MAAGRRRGACPAPCVSREALPGERGWDLCSEHHVSMLHQDVWPRVPARDRAGTLRQLKARSGGRSYRREAGPRCVGSLPACARRRRTRRTPRNTVGRPLCLLVRMRRPHQASCPFAGGTRRDGEPQGSRCDERDGRTR